jgi:hypothetical protein
LLAEKRLAEFIARIGKGKPESFQVEMLISGSQLVGCTIENPLTHQTLPLIDDPSFNSSFGSGFKSVTPAHNIDDLRLSYLYE